MYYEKDQSILLNKPEYIEAQQVLVRGDSYEPSAIATLANETAFYDLTLFLRSLQVWNECPPPIYVYCTSNVEMQIKKIPYKGTIYTKNCLDKYANLTRVMMESMKSKEGLSNLFHDFTQEKCGLMEWALQSLPEELRINGVLFCDADIFWLGPLPKIPNTASLGLSPHMIHTSDEAKYGTYNAGFLWTNQQTMPEKWRSACKISRFFEQAALETLEDDMPDEKVYKFGPDYNYGWWRMYQSPNGVSAQQKAWTICRDVKQSHSGLCVDGQPLCCIHTHWKPNDSSTLSFNIWMMEQFNSLSKEPKVKSLLSIICSIGGDSSIS